MDPEDRPLTHLQEAFIEHYLITFNQAEAVRLAGYNVTSDVSARNIGSSNMRKPHIRKALRERMSETIMQADEVLARLTDQAMVDMGDFIVVDSKGHFSYDMRKVKQHGRLIQSLKRNKDGSVTLTLVSSKAALDRLGQYHDLFADVNVNLREIDRAIERQLERLASASQGKTAPAPDGDPDTEGST